MEPCLTPADWLRSLDGLHPSDITQWISMSPNSSIAQLYRQGTFYSGYFVKQAPGDEFPGVLGPLTGAKTLYTDHGHGRHSVLVTCSPGYGGPDAVTCAPEAKSNTILCIGVVSATAVAVAADFITCFSTSRSRKASTWG